jgi:uncharacterized protein YlxW (UPF0749 family)
MTVFGEYPSRPQPAAGTAGSRWKTIVLVVAAGVLVVAALAAALYIAVRAQLATATLITQNRHLQTQVTDLKGQVTGLQGQASTIQARENTDYSILGKDLVPLAQYATTQCSQDLNGPDGPTQYYFLCTSTKPSSQNG